MKFTCDWTKNATNTRDRNLPLLAAQVMFNGGMVAPKILAKSIRKDVLSAITR
jgi:hypothetical protein